MNKGSAVVAILFAFFCGIAIGRFTAGGEGAEITADTAADSDDAVGAAQAGEGPDRYKVPVSEDQPKKGAEAALVTVVEFSDFQCPFCKRVNPTLEKLQKDYGDKLRIVWRNNPLPFHKDAMPAAQAAMEAFEQGGDEKFWAMHDKLFQNTKKLSRADLEQYAKEVGLDVGEVKKALDGGEHKKQIQQDQALAKRLGARGTPGFFINGRFLSGAQPINAFKKIIDEEVEAAEKLLKAGIDEEKIYTELTKKGLTKAKPPEKKQAKKKRQPDPDAVYKVPMGDAPVKGPKNALVTIVEFSDFQCPFCKRVNPTIDKIRETYGKDVRVAFKHNPLPFHKDAGPAAQLAIEAQKQGKFWAAHDKLFENNKSLSRSDLERYAKELGLNVAKVKQALDTKKYQDQIDADQKLARSLGATGTPSFFINGRNLRGAQPFSAFKKVIDEELAKAKAMVKKGTPKSKVYEKIIAKGATTPQFVNAGGDDNKPGRPSADKEYDIKAASKAPYKGSRNAKVVIQEFSDFQCPFCSRVLPTVEKVIDEYGDKVKIVWRNYPLPFHKDAALAAEASLEVYAQGGNDKFWKYHDILFDNQKALSKDDLIKYAKQVGGINMSRFKAALDNHTHKKKVDADMQAVKSAGARIGTPSFFINGKLLQGAQPYPAFKAAIDKALKDS